MSSVQDQLFLEGLSDLGLSPEQTSFLQLVTTTFVGHPEVLRSSMLHFISGETSYRYKPIIGAELVFTYDFDQQLVQLTRLSEELTLTIPVFLRFMSLVDLVYGVIHPLGTIVELDRDLLLAPLLQGFEQVDQPLFVHLSGRRVPMKESGFYVDYIGYLYPQGLNYDSHPLYLSQLYIKRVVSEGYRNPKDEAYCEVQAQKSRLKLQLGQVREQLASTKQSLVGVRGSTALEGQVKEAIDAKINNHHLPLLSNYENALTMIERSYSQLIREFKSITGETSDTAIINTDYLTDLKTKVGGILTDSQNLNSEASRIYSSISDILPLSSPSLSEMSQAKSEMDKFLTKLIADMATFDGLSQDKGIESLLTAQNQELSSLGQAVGLGYHHSGASTFFAQTDFRRSVKEVG